MRVLTKIILGLFALVVLSEIVPLTWNALQTNCSNPVSFYLYCNSIPAYWMNAMNWISQNLGSNSIPHQATILAWWDYGDWINWFGHANAVLRGDNQIASLDYKTAYMFVDGNQTQLVSFMKSVNAKYLLLSSDDLQKWSALNYLSCIYLNQTILQKAVGTSPCEINNEPTYLLAPASPNVVTDYCNFGNTSITYLKAISNTGTTSYCLQVNQNQIDGKIYDTNGTLIPYLNLIPMTQQTLGGTVFNVYLMLYEPLASTCNYPANETVPKFYESNYYKMFLLGCQGSQFTQIYPANNAVGAVRIWELNNFTATPIK
ncbi:MAG: hypothetical protein ACYCS1_05160 [Gammaproteobacteria bacterium]